MKKKLGLSILISSLLLVLVVAHVIAGASYDIGTLAPKIEGGTPPGEGEANWIAWWSEYPNGTPYEILTEDVTNADDGENIGYSDFFGTGVNWILQIQNFLYDPGQNVPPFFEPDPIYLKFGGLGDEYSGTLWEQTITEWKITEYLTDWGEATLISLDPMNECPTISVQPIPEPENPGDGRTFSFSGPIEGATYHIYRSQNASGANNGASNGQYFYIETVTLTENKNLYVYTDNTEIQDGPAWYLVIRADPDSNAIIGCHSEEGIPTNVTMGEFTAFYDDEKSAVVLEWETVSETNIVGFNVFRGTSETLVGSVKINTEIIPAKQPGSPVGDIYTFEDADVVDGQTYYYWIEILTNDMSDQTVGPESVTIPETAWFYYFLPLLFN